MGQLRGRRLCAGGRRGTGAAAAGGGVERWPEAAVGAGRARGAVGRRDRRGRRWSRRRGAVGASGGRHGTIVSTARPPAAGRSGRRTSM